jgi:ATP/ADP translocase
VTRLLPRLTHTLGVHRGEERLFLWGAATLFLLGWASVSLTNVSETLFLKRVGVDRLPLVFLANGILLVGTTYGMSHIAARADRRRLLATTFAGLAAGVVVLWLLLLSNFSGVFVLLVIASKQLDAIALIAFWIVVGSMLHGRQAKRLYAPIIAGGTLGRILGSFASGLVGNAFGIAALLPVSAAAVGCACVLAARMRSVAPVRLTQTAKTLVRPAPLARFAPLWRESRLFRILAFGSLLAGTLGPMLYFQFSYVVDAATHGHNGELRLLDLYAKLRGFINASVLAMQLVGTARVFRRIGVPLAATLSPVVYLLGFLGVSARLDLSAGIGAVGTTNLQD